MADMREVSVYDKGPLKLGECPSCKRKKKDKKK